MSHSEELELIRRAQGGDLDAFGGLVAMHQASVRACLAARVPSMADAEELAQEVFLLAFQKLPRLDASGGLGPWLRAVALNMARNHRRKLGRANSAAAVIHAMVEGVIDATEARGHEEAMLSAVERCVEELDPPSRELVRLRYAEGRPVAELREKFDRKHSAVTMWLHRLRLALRDCIERKMGEEIA